MFLMPPTRSETKYVDGKEAAPSSATFDLGRAKKLVAVYRKVAERCDRECESCGKAYLAAPHLRLAVLDPNADWFTAKNVRMLCTTCNAAREATLTPSAAEVTGIAREAVFKREHGRCFYCGYDMRYLHLATVAGRVDSPDVTRADDWLCCCSRCLKLRGSRSHEDYTETAMQNAFDLWAELRERVEVMRAV